MTCSSCKYLKEDNKHVGALSGAKYYCTKVKNYVDGSNNKCSYYDEAYSRSNYKCNEIYFDGRNFSDDDKPISFYITILILITIFGLLIAFINSINM